VNRLRALVALAGILTVWGAFRVPAASPEVEAVPPTTAPPPGAALLSEIDALHQRVQIHASYYAGRESWLDVGVHPAPAPRRWGRR